MANYYWVGGTASWNGTALLKWAATSGGLPTYLTDPTSADDVFFDANSGSGTVTVATTAPSCLNLDFTGFTGTFDGSQTLSIYGNLTLSSGMTFSHTGLLLLSAGSGSKTITSNGIVITSSNVVIEANPSGTYSLNDDLVLTGDFKVNYGTFNANNFNVDCSSFNSSGINTRSVIMGSGLWGIGSALGWNINTTTNLTFNANTSTLDFYGTGVVTFATGGLSYSTVIYGNPSAGQLSILTGCSIDTLGPVSLLSGNILQFTSGDTYNINNFNINGNVSNIIVIRSNSAGSSFTFSKSSGTVTANYLSIKDSVATGGATFYANNSTDAGGNSGWIFTVPTNNGNMMLVF